MTYQSFLYCLWWSCLCNLCLHDIRSVQVTRFSLSLLCSQVFLDVFLPRIQINREENKTASSHSVSIPFFPLLGCLSASLLVFLRFSFFFFFRNVTLPRRGRPVWVLSLSPLYVHTSQRSEEVRSQGEMTGEERREKTDSFMWQASRGPEHMLFANIEASLSLLSHKSVWVETVRKRRWKASQKKMWRLHPSPHPSSPHINSQFSAKVLKQLFKPPQILFELFQFCISYQSDSTSLK